MTWTRNLLIWSQTRYRCATESTLDEEQKDYFSLSMVSRLSKICVDDLVLNKEYGVFFLQPFDPTQATTLWVIASIIQDERIKFYLRIQKEIYRLRISFRTSRKDALLRVSFELCCLHSWAMSSPGNLSFNHELSISTGHEVFEQATNYIIFVRESLKRLFTWQLNRLGWLVQGCMIF